MVLDGVLVVVGNGGVVLAADVVLFETTEKQTLVVSIRIKTV